MKGTLFTVAAAMFLAGSTACNSQSKIKVNDQKMELKDGLYALFHTSQGDILAQLEMEKTPMTVGNFVALAEGKMKNDAKPLGTPFYDGILFHRVIPNFMVQCGDPQGTGMGGPGYQFPDEIDATLKHDQPGILSMANAGPGTNGSQFFITHVATPWLDGKHTVFGKVIEGQNIVVNIGNAPKGAQDKPSPDIKIEKLEIIRVGKAAKAFDGVKAFEGGKAALEAKVAAQRAEGEKWFNELNAKAQQTESGLRYIITSEGNGKKPAAGTKVKVHYAGYLTDHSLFDSSIKEVAVANNKYDARREPYAPFEVEVGPNAPVIEGWKEGLTLLNYGGKATLIIPPHLGYGARGAGGVIPPNATLVFDVEIVE
jgi:peptidylprolyl isomerase